MKSIRTRFLLPLAAVSLAVLTAACATPNASVPPPELSCLRVGFAPNYPPVCMNDAEGNPSGIEADFAAALADELGCPMEIVTMEFKELFPALMDGRVDIVMAGLTVTPSRAYKVRFCSPYLNNPLVAVARVGWARTYPSSSHVLAASAFIGVLPHTTAETFVRRHCPRARVVPVFNFEDVPKDIASHRYVIYVDDQAAVLDLAESHADVLEIIPYPLQQQEMAWAVHPDNAALLSAANAALSKWKANGKLDAVLDRWLPGRFR